MVKIEIVYAAADKSIVQLFCDIPQDFTVQQALEQSGLWRTHPETQALAVGIFSKLVSMETRLREGDRIEIYRPLLMDPKEARKRRVKK